MEIIYVNKLHRSKLKIFLRLLLLPKISCTRKEQTIWFLNNLRSGFSRSLLIGKKMGIVFNRFGYQGSFSPKTHSKFKIFLNLYARIVTKSNAISASQVRTIRKNYCDWYTMDKEFLNKLAKKDRKNIEIGKICAITPDEDLPHVNVLNSYSFSFSVRTKYLVMQVILYVDLRTRCAYGYYENCILCQIWDLN